MSGMENPIWAALALDGLPLGSLVVACGVDGKDGTAYGILYQHVETAFGQRWVDLTSGSRVKMSAREIVAIYDDMVVAGLGGAA